MTRKHYIVVDMKSFSGNFMFRGSFEECKQWVSRQEDKERYRIMQ